MKYRNLNLKYALINVFYFMLVCGTAGYANNYLQFKGFDTSVIGIILTVVSIIALIGQTGMAPIVDRSKTLNEKRFIIITLLVAAAMYIAMLFLPNGSPLVMCCAVVGFAFAAMGIPYLNSLAFIYEQEGQTINYGLGRGAGSAAYAVAGLCIGQLIKLKDASVVPYWLLAMTALTLVVVSTLKVPDRIEQPEAEKNAGEEKPKASYGAFFRKYSDILIIVIAMICLFFTHMLINNYMINIIENIGGDAGSQGTATFIQAMVELPPMFAFAIILKKFKVDTLMLWGAIFYTVKHILILIAPNMTVYYIAMVLQMLSYAIIVPGSVYFADAHVAPEDRNQGQAIMSATTTIGGLFASFIGGMLLNSLGAGTTLTIGAVISAIGTVLMIYGIIRLKGRKA